MIAIALTAIYLLLFPVDIFLPPHEASCSLRVYFKVNIKPGDVLWEAVRSLISSYLLESRLTHHRFACLQLTHAMEPAYTLRTTISSFKLSLQPACKYCIKHEKKNLYRFESPLCFLWGYSSEGIVWGLLTTLEPVIWEIKPQRAYRYKKVKRCISFWKTCSL